MKVLILNWRDIKNPTSGGAEILTHEMAKRWAKRNNEITQISSYFSGAKKEEKIDGIKIVRIGHPDARSFFGSVHFEAFNYYRQNSRKFDVILDEIHGIPFFTPLYTKKKKVALICEVAGRLWDKTFPFPFNLIGKFVEKNYFKFYKNVYFLTISDSTREELTKFGVKKEKIVVLPMGISQPSILPKFVKETNPTLIFVARVLKTKGIEDAIKACEILKRKMPNIRLWVVGKEEKKYGKKLREMVSKMDLRGNVKFFGFVDQAKKFGLMQKAHVLVVPSIKEGFGLTVPEAGLVGTPVVAYNVEGLRDIIRNGNGILVRQDFESLAQGVQKLLEDKALYRKMSEMARKDARKLNWDNTADIGLEVLKK